jgi:hypothetical protein
MEVVEKSKKMTFRDYYKSLDEEQKREVRDKYLAASGMSFPTFYSKLRRGNYTLLEQKAIESICETSLDW